MLYRNPNISLFTVLVEMIIVVIKCVQSGPTRHFQKDTAVFKLDR